MQLVDIPLLQSGQTEINQIKHHKKINPVEDMQHEQKCNRQ